VIILYFVGTLNYVLGVQECSQVKPALELASDSGISPRDSHPQNSLEANRSSESVLHVHDHHSSDFFQVSTNLNSVYHLQDNWEVNMASNSVGIGSSTQFRH